MNTTTFIDAVMDGMCSGDHASIVSVILGVLFAISEALALSGRTRCNGIAHMIKCLLNAGSECPATPAAQQPPTHQNSIEDTTTPNRTPARPQAETPVVTQSKITEDKHDEQHEHVHGDF